jgi:succinyl-diaminopimelate desuccinylase
MDTIAFTQALLRCPSITPHSGGSLALIAAELEKLGFCCELLPFGAVENLYAKKEGGGKTLCFAGHVDVVPPGPLDQWQHSPFAGTLEDGILHGRGAVDMKPAIAAFIAAVAQTEDHRKGPGSIALLLTSDEEGPGQDGTRRVVELLKARGETLAGCIVGEPTSVNQVGDTLKIGRRGSLGAHVVVRGMQGHVAYPQEAKNPIPLLLEILSTLQERILDKGDVHFQPSRMEITTIDVGNPASNVIPSSAEARFNIRFTPAHTRASLRQWIEDVVSAFPEVEVSFAEGSEAFLTQPGSLCRIAEESAKKIIGISPCLSTSGGTSDARFLAPHFPTVELGLRHSKAHQINEQVPVADMDTLQQIYTEILRRFFDEGGRLC